MSRFISASADFYIHLTYFPSWDLKVRLWSVGLEAPPRGTETFVTQCCVLCLQTAPLFTDGEAYTHRQKELLFKTEGLKG